MKNNIFRKAIITATILLITILLAASVYVHDLPETNGKYKVGVKEFVLTDNSRNEFFVDDNTIKRTILVKIWYPVKDNDGFARENYQNTLKYDAPLYVTVLTRPIIFSKTNSYRDAPIAQDVEKFPVILFSHGTKGEMNFYTILAEALAANGYVVAGISHTYDAGVTLFPHGNAVLCNKEKFSKTNDIEINNRQTRQLAAELVADSGNTRDESEQLFSTVLSKIKKSDNVEANREITFETLFAKKLKGMDAAERKAFFEKMMDIMKRMNSIDSSYYFREPFNTRVEDAKFVLDELINMNKNKTEFFYDRLNTAKAGIFGHSEGGTLAERMCLVDERFAAGINMDGTAQGGLEGRSMQKPFMLLYSEHRKISGGFYAKLGLKDLYDEMYNNAGNDIYSVIIKGSEHANFTDIGAIFPIANKIEKGFDGFGDIDPLRMAEIERTCMVSFFNRYLKDKEISVNTMIDFNEVDFKYSLRKSN
jgi:hypothetical protein